MSSSNEQEQPTPAQQFRELLEAKFSDPTLHTRTSKLTEDESIELVPTSVFSMCPDAARVYLRRPLPNSTITKAIDGPHIEVAEPYKRTSNFYARGNTVWVQEFNLDPTQGVTKRPVSREQFMAQMALWDPAAGEGQEPRRENRMLEPSQARELLDWVAQSIADPAL